ncbi:MAG: hypothetical protein ABSD08_15370 [Xanthobacteraceae bacterium]|jgi:hypothetical protein
MTVLFAILVHLVLFCAAILQLVLVIYLIFRYDPNSANHPAPSLATSEEREALEEQRDKLELEIDTLEKKLQKAHADEELDPQLRKMRRQLEKLAAEQKQQFFDGLHIAKRGRSEIHFVDDFTMRAIAAIVGLLLYLGARALGISIPALLIRP